MHAHAHAYMRLRVRVVPSSVRARKRTLHAAGSANSRADLQSKARPRYVPPPAPFRLHVRLCRWFCACARVALGWPRRCCWAVRVVRWYSRAHVCACACVGACVRVRFPAPPSLSAFRRVSGRVFMVACVSECVSVCVCVPAKVCIERVCVCVSRLRRRSHGAAGSGGIYSSDAARGPALCVCRLCPSSVALLAAGVTWTSRTTSAQWAARKGHTSVIDAAGAIYVIGGYDGTKYFNDVLVSTDRGAGRKWVVLAGYSGVPKDDRGLLRVV
jgi:hypothetical protein